MRVPVTESSQNRSLVQHTVIMIHIHGYCPKCGWDWQTVYRPDKPESRVDAVSRLKEQHHTRSICCTQSIEILDC